MVEKLIRDGHVAVLVSHGFGAGWSTWASDGQEETMLFDAVMVQRLLDDDYDGVEARVRELFGDDDMPYTGGIDGLTVHFVPVGTVFRIHEYDGAESLILLSQEKHHTA